MLAPFLKKWRNWNWNDKHNWPCKLQSIAATIFVSVCSITLGKHWCRCCRSAPPTNQITNQHTWCQYCLQHWLQPVTAAQDGKKIIMRLAKRFFGEDTTYYAMQSMHVRIIVNTSGVTGEGDWDPVVLISKQTVCLAWVMGPAVLQRTEYIMKCPGNIYYRYYVVGKIQIFGILH